MTERENALIALNHGVPEWVPWRGDSTYMVGSTTVHENGQVDDYKRGIGGMDDWGVEWILPNPDAKGQAFPLHKTFVMDDITKWREQVRIPDVDAMDWEGAPARELADYHGDKLLVYFDTEGLFNRLTDLMGMEEALCALLTEPEACEEFFSAVADYKIKIVKKAAQYLKPDVFCYMDDVASANGLLMSPSLWRKLIKPHHARIISAICECGMIPEQHCCGKCEAIVPDFVEMGCQAWIPAQKINNLEDIQFRFGKQLCLDGGVDSSGGKCFQPSGTYQDGVDEVHRCLDSYAKNGNYMLHAFFFGPEGGKRGFIEEATRYGKSFYQRTP